MLKSDEYPLISVILPVYNIKNYIGRCMDSLFSQTYENLELILVDDGSTDGSSELCDQLAQNDSRVVVLHKKNGGLSDARNYGIYKSTGVFITCVDPDDYVDRDYVEYLYTLLSKHNTKMSICQHKTFYDNGSKVDHGKSGDELLSNKDCIERMLYHDVIDTSAWAKLYSCELFENVQYPFGKLFEDIGTTYALMLQCEKIAVGYESKYNYIFHNNSIVNGKFNIKKLDMLEMTDKMANDVIKIYPDLIMAVDRRQVYARFSTLNQMIGTKDYQDEREEIISFIKNHKQCIINNSKAPRRDKVALMLLQTSYKLYEKIWSSYKSRIMNK